MSRSPRDRLVHGRMDKSDKWTIYDMNGQSDMDEQHDLVSTQKDKQHHSTAQKIRQQQRSTARKMKHHERVTTCEEAFVELLIAEEVLKREAAKKEAMRAEAMKRQVEHAEKMALIRQEKQEAKRQKKHASQQKIKRACLEKRENDADALFGRLRPLSDEKYGRKKIMHRQINRLNSCQLNDPDMHTRYGKSLEQFISSRKKKNEQLSRARERHDKYASRDEADEEAFRDAVEAEALRCERIALAADQEMAERAYERRAYIDDDDDQDYSKVRPEAEVNPFATRWYRGFNAYSSDYCDDVWPTDSTSRSNYWPTDSTSRSNYDTSQYARQNPHHDVEIARAAVAEARAKLVAANDALTRALDREQSYYDSYL